MEPFIKYVQVHVRANEDFYSEFLDIGGKGFNDPYDQLVNVYTYKVKNYWKMAMNKDGSSGNAFNAVMILRGFDYDKSVYQNISIIIKRLFEGRYDTLWFYAFVELTSTYHVNMKEYLGIDILNKPKPTWLHSYSPNELFEQDWKNNLPYYDTSFHNGKEGEDYRFAHYDVTPWKVESKTKSASKIDKTM